MNSSFSLETLASDLPLADEGQSLVGRKISGFQDRHLARDREGFYSILFATSFSTCPAPVVLENLSVEHGVKCRIQDRNGNVIEGTFSVIRCNSTEEFLIIYFLRIMESLILLIPEYPNTTDISNLVDRLAQLFLALQRPPQKPIQGLWAELFLILQSNNPAKLVSAWHNDPTECFDFSDGADCVEVKSTSKRGRSHHFSYRQAYPPNEMAVVVASISVEESAGGLSFGSLWEIVRSAVVPDTSLRLKIDQVCIQTLGETWERALEKCYNDELARESLAFFDIRDIPKISQEIPDGVSEVSFWSDLDKATPISLSNHTHSLLRHFTD